MHEESQTTANRSPGGGAAAGRWVSLHVPKSRDELRQKMTDELASLLPQASLAILILEKGEWFRVEIVQGSRCPLTQGHLTERKNLTPEPTTTVPLLYEQHAIGQFVAQEALTDAEMEELEPLLLHYSTALVNLELKAESTRATDYYCASLQAFEEGVVLFQEQNPEAIGARFLDLCTTVLGAKAGAVYVLEQIGNAESRLQLDHAWGLPDHLLEDLVLADGTWWPQTLLRGQLEFLQRNLDTDEFESLDNERVPAPLQNLVGASMHYHGVDVGVCTLFNVDQDAAQEKLESAQRLFELGAAVFHRRQLEAEAMISKQFETQLEIASTIQQRLIPAAAPENPHFDFAWWSHPAQMVGGDYVDLIDGGNDLFAVIADVSGHGINSALLMTSFRAACRAKSMQVDPDELLARLNETVHQEVGDTAMFLTVAALRLDGEGGRFLFSSAGHNPAYLYRPGEDRFQVLDSSGPPLGFFNGMTYGVEELRGEPGDVLVLYTDGIVEATGIDGVEMFETDRLQAQIREHAVAGADAVRDGILEAVRTFTGDKAQEDDISVLVVRFNG